MPEREAMLYSIASSHPRCFALKDVSHDGMKGCLVPQMGIRNTHIPISITLYDDGVLRIGMIQINIALILPRLKSCGITATAWEGSMVGVNLDLRSVDKEHSARVYFEYDYNKPWQNPLYLVRDRGHAPLHLLKPFSQLSWSRRLAKLLLRAYPRITV